MLEQPGFEFRNGKGFFWSPNRPDQLWGPLRVVMKWYQLYFKRLGRDSFRVCYCNHQLMWYVLGFEVFDVTGFSTVDLSVYIIVYIIICIYNIHVMYMYIIYIHACVLKHAASNASES